MPPCRRCALVAGLLSLLVAPSANARRGVRPLFEPTDLELENPGVAEFDLQVGAVRSQGPARVVVPDFEIDVGLLRNLELDLDGSYAIEGPPAGPFAFDHAAPDSLWFSVKLGLVDWTDAWALGLQVGPKIPVATGSHGVGGEALALLGHVIGRTHLVLNAGAFVDPHPDAVSDRPIGLELGLDFNHDLDPAGHYSITAEASGVRFLSSDPDQLLATAGFAWSPRESLQFSIVAMWGFLSGSDRYGVLLGFSPKLTFFRR